jgi:predicted nucleic acid-binding protein
MIVVADSSPLRYLILIEHAHVLPALYGRVLIPPAVSGELNRQRTPPLVRAWMAHKPTWLEIRAPQRSLAGLAADLGTGEREAIALAEELVADAVLLDDWAARLEAQRRHLTVLGTLRVRADAAEMGFADLRVAMDRLQQTNFRARPELIQALLKLDAGREHH